MPNRRMCTFVPLAAAVLSLSACGSGNEKAITDSGGVSSVQARAELDLPVPTVDDVTDLSAVISSSPHWQVIRRAPLPDADEVLASAHGYIVGRLVAVERSPTQTVTADEVAGVSVPLVEDDGGGVPTAESAPSPVLRADGIDLIIAVDSVWSRDSTFPASLERVRVPLALAVGPAAPDRDAVVDGLLTEARQVAPLGAEVLVLAESVRDDVPPEVVTPGSRWFRAPLSVVFAVDDSSLASLDWLLSVEADEYFSATSIEELAGEVAAAVDD